jgi:hypothetical protein
VIEHVCREGGNSGHGATNVSSQQSAANQPDSHTLSAVSSSSIHSLLLFLLAAFLVQSGGGESLLLVL